MFKHQDQRVGIFIDTQNMYYSARNLFKRKVNFRNIVLEAVGGRKLIRAMAYVVTTQSDESRPFFDALQKSGIETREKELLEYDSGFKKGDWDVGLAIDVVQMLDVLDVVILVTGDGDFIPLVQYVQSRGRLAEIVGFRETTSSALIEAAHAYTNLSENRRRFLIGSISNSKQTTTEETEPDDVDENLEGFFMPAKHENPPEQEDTRNRRLEF